MDPNASDDDSQQQVIQPSPDAGKLVIKGIMTHGKLLSLIKERNPIIARAGTTDAVEAGSRCSRHRSQDP